MAKFTPKFTLGKTHGGVSHQVAVLSILGFWLFYIIIVTLRAAVMDFPEQGEMAMRRIVVTIFGIGLTYLLYLLLRRFEGRPLTTRVIVAFLGAVPCALALAAFNFVIFNLYDPASLFVDPEMKEMYDAYRAKPNFVPSVIAEVAISRYFFFVAWPSLYLAMSYAADVRIIERKAARFAQAAQDAELRSLRYQVNPHFLFNTLNSLSTLVLRQRPDEAEQMILNLSNFYRQSLSGDPLADVELAEEVHLQRLYLDIEAVRFPERLRTCITIPDDLQSALVPSLILQPLVENAIKYGVSRAKRPVTISIDARQEEDCLILRVTDDGDILPGDIGGDEAVDVPGPSPRSANGGIGGIGLANVRDRLETRFGNEARLTTRRPESGGFVAELSMPLLQTGRL
jgi:anti-sigma regulatory factor (Ser/Thr protein kinase)